MRWFVVFLLLANLVLFFWMKQDALSPGTAELPPPEVGRLRLLTENGRPQEDANAIDVQDAASSAIANADPAHEATSLEPAPYGSATVGPPPASRISSLSTQTGEPVSPDHLATALSSGGGGIIPVDGSERDGPAANAGVAEAEAPALGDESESPISASDAEPHSPADPVTADLGVATPLRVCARIGPLQPTDADALIAGLPRPLTLVSDTIEETEVVDGYYVLVPPLPDRASGQRVLKQLGEAGFSDTWLFRKGPFENAISLGLFSRENSAQRHADAVAEKGFDIEVRARTSTEEVRWVTVSHQGEGKVREALPMPVGVDLTELPCPR